MEVNGATAHSLYTTNDRGVNEVAPRDTLRCILVLRTHDLLIEPPHLSRRGRRSAINTVLNDRNMDSTTSMTYALRCAATSLEVAVRRSPARGYPFAMLNSMALGRASGLWGKLLLKDFIHAQSWTRRAWYERAWCGGPNGI